MTIDLQSNAMLLDAGEKADGYGNTSKLIYSSWRMPDYALEYVVERDVFYRGPGQRRQRWPEQHKRQVIQH
jgi:hypothetical protein